MFPTFFSYFVNKSLNLIRFVSLILELICLPPPLPVLFLCSSFFYPWVSLGLFLLQFTLIVCAECNYWMKSGCSCLQSMAAHAPLIHVNTLYIDPKKIISSLCTSSISATWSCTMDFWERNVLSQLPLDRTCCFPALCRYTLFIEKIHKRPKDRLCIQGGVAPFGCSFHLNELLVHLFHAVLNHRFETV